MAVEGQTEATDAQVATNIKAAEQDRVPALPASPHQSLFQAVGDMASMAWVNHHNSETVMVRFRGEVPTDFFYEVQQSDYEIKRQNPSEYGVCFSLQHE